MVRGLYTAVSGALTAQSAVDTIANNLANVNTNGFKRTLLQVQAQPETDVYRSQTDPGSAPGAPGVATTQYVGQLGSGAQVYDTPAIFAQGAIASTGNDLDVALSGPGLFTVRTAANAVRFTRDGSFERNAQGLLSTQNGDLVLGSDGAPVALPDQGKVTIGRDGTLTANGQTIGRLGVVEFANPTALRPEGASLFTDTGTAAPRAAAGTTALQGSVEKSNADVIGSMVDLITNERWFDANEQVIQTEDTATGLAISTVGRTNS